MKSAEMLMRLAEYEDTGMTPQEVAALEARLQEAQTENKRITKLEAELARLQVALEATIAEKGKYKRALKIACEVNSDMFATSEEAMIYCIRQATGRP